MDAVSVRNLEKKYGDFSAIRNISFTVKEGEIFGLIGPNGAGKSTILRILSGILQQTAGEAEIFGYGIPKDMDRIRKIISYLPEAAGAYKSMTGREYLRFISRIYCGPQNYTPVLERGLEITDLGEKIDVKIGKYSKGMLRKLLVARTLMTKPKIAILDEPSSGLDIFRSREIRDLMKKEAGRGMSFILSSHNMLEIEELCNRIAFINRGEIVRIDSPRVLRDEFQNHSLSDIFFALMK